MEEEGRGGERWRGEERDRDEILEHFNIEKPRKENVSIKC